MIGRLNHVAIAVPDLEAAAAQYRDTLGAEVGAPQDEPDHGVTVVFINLPNTKVELLYPLGLFLRVFSLYGHGGVFSRWRRCELCCECSEKIWASLIVGEKHMVKTTSPHIFHFIIVCFLY